MSEQTSTPRARERRVRWAGPLLCALAVLASVAFGVSTASVEANLGPHAARYAMTTDDTVTVDLGPLGTLEVDSPLPLDLGVRVTVQEIPETFTQVDQAMTLQALSGDLHSYVQLFSDPKATVVVVARAMVLDALGRAVTALAVLVGLWFAGRALLGSSRRSELAAHARAHRRQVWVAATAVVVLVVVVGADGHVVGRPEARPEASPVFDGTALEGARVTGRLAGVIDTYGAQALDAYERNQAFYARADEALAVSWDRTSAQLAQAQDLFGPGAGPVAPERDVQTLVVVSDIHCNTGMAPLITTLVRRSGASVVLDAGDTTMNGTAVEQFCVGAIARAVPSGVDLVTSPGNHDSAETSAMYAKAGATVLEGKVVEVDGLRILGDHDPNETRVGVGTSTAGTESEAQETARLADVACDDDKGVDLLLIHTPWVGDDTLARGCVPAQVSGHLHRQVGPEVVGLGVRYVSSSTAGATLGQPTIGPLHGTAAMTVLHVDRETHRVRDYQLVHVRTNGTVEVSMPQEWPALPVLPPATPPVPGVPALDVPGSSPSADPTGAGQVG
ncbi:metallophosphoesterase [Cellulomonas sp. HZM]|uniref:metallophosphoesterase family protein n=1 Tax=Cellulomonas sp. HZM TaxID=1454010 RepID=UPI0009E02FE9|nr:metallophosphoesterase [Cellulomonas sp. HZM]